MIAWWRWTERRNFVRVCSERWEPKESEPVSATEIGEHQDRDGHHEQGGNPETVLMVQVRNSIEIHAEDAANYGCGGKEGCYDG